MSQMRISFLGIIISFFAQPHLHSMDLMYDGISLVASGLILNDNAPHFRTFYNCPPLRRALLLGDGRYVRPSIPSCGLALCTLAELYASYFPKGKGVATINRIQKKHPHMYQGSKMVIALPLINFWSRALFRQGTQVLGYAANNLLAPLSLYLAGSQWVPAARTLRDHIFLHRKKRHRRTH